MPTSLLRQLFDQAFFAGADDSAIDEALGLSIASCEQNVQTSLHLFSSDVQTWHSKGPAVFLTPYREYGEIFSLLDPKTNLKPLHWIELGAGYGRLAFVLKAFRTLDRYCGFEIVRERVNETKRVFSRWGLDPESFFLSDIASPDFDLPEADVFFIYDFSTGPQIDLLLEKLKTQSRRRPLCVVARGGLVRNRIDRNHPWLGQVHPPAHTPHFSIYRS